MHNQVTETTCKDFCSMGLCQSSKALLIADDRLLHFLCFIKQNETSFNRDTCCHLTLGRHRIEPNCCSIGLSESVSVSFKAALGLHLCAAKVLRNFFWSGYCAIDYGESASTSPDPFQLGSNAITTALAVSKDQSFKSILHSSEILSIFVKTPEMKLTQWN